MDQSSSPESNALTLRIKFKSASLEEFISRYGVDVSPGGIFIRTRQPVDVGTTLQFDFSLADGSSLLAGLGTVAWIRENDPSRTNNVPGMGLRFDKLTVESQQNHQTILAEKAHKEGKPQGTPYPPTAFVLPAGGRPSPAPESPRASVESVAKPDPLAKPEPSPADFTKTLPAPAAAIVARVVDSASESDDFDGGGKTEISDKPIEELLREAEAAQEQTTAPPPAAAPGEDYAPKSPLEDWQTDAHPLEDASAPPAPEEVSIADSQAYATEAPVPPALTESGERRPSDKNFFAAMLDLGDTAENADGVQVPAAVAGGDDSSGVPLAATTSDKTEEVSLLPSKSGDDVAELVDLGGTTPEDVIESVPPLGEIPEPQARKSRRGPVLMVGAVLFAGAAAFAAVYVLQTKPWERTSDPERATVLVKKRPAVASLPASPQPPAPTPPPAALPKPAPAEATGEKPAAVEAPKPAAAEEKVVVKEEKAPAKREKAAAKEEKPAAATAKPAAEKPAAEKVTAEKPPAEKPEPAKPAEEKPLVAKAEPEAPAGKHPAKPAAKAAAKASAEPATGEKVTAGATEEDVYRLAFRSVPIGAEVLIDGEYYARTPCERRILDPKKSLAITVRKEGYEPHERMIGSSDNWVKKGNERVLSVSVNLKKIKAAAEGEGAASAGGGEGKTVLKPAPDEPHKE